MSTISDIKYWSEKSLSQIERIGKVLYDDAIIESKKENATAIALLDRLYIEHVEYMLDISSGNQHHNLDLETLTNMIMTEFENSTMLSISINTTRFSLFLKENIYYWYDPNGVDDENNEIRPSVCCFSSFEQLISHIFKIGSILSSITFSVNFVKCRKLQ